jgi:hypothetical protein
MCLAPAPQKSQIDVAHAARAPHLFGFFLPSSKEGGGALRRRPLWDFRMAIAKDGLAKFFESA